MKSTLLGHSSIHKPIVQLLEARKPFPGEGSYDVQVETIKLINSLTIKLKESPMLTRLFWTVSPCDRGEDGIVLRQDIRHFILFNKLDRMYRTSTDSRLVDQIRRCILRTIIIDDSCEDMQVYLSKQSKFITHTVCKTQDTSNNSNVY